VRKRGISEELVEQFAEMYLSEGLARWGVLYIDAHFLPYYGMYPISKGWQGGPELVRKRRSGWLCSLIGKGSADRCTAILTVETRITRRSGRFL